MIWQYRHRFRALLIGAIILFPWCGIMGMADAEPGDTQDPGTTSVGKRQGQSPALKPSKTASGGTAPVGKRQGQSPALKPQKQPLKTRERITFRWMTGDKDSHPVLSERAIKIQLNFV